MSSAANRCLNIVRQCLDLSAWLWTDAGPTLPGIAISLVAVGTGIASGPPHRSDYKAITITIKSVRFWSCVLAAQATMGKNGASQRPHGGCQRARDQQKIQGDPGPIDFGALHSMDNRASWQPNPAIRKRRTQEAADDDRGDEKRQPSQQTPVPRLPQADAPIPRTPR